MSEQDQASSLRVLVPGPASGFSREEVPAARAVLPCRVIAVSSGKGGVGKTSLTLNLGLALVARGKKVMVFDADLGLANINVLLNKVPAFNLEDVAWGRKTLAEVVISGPRGLRIVPGGSGLFELANLDGSRRERIIDQLAALEEEVDFILIDTAAGLSRNVIGFVAAAGELILVTTPEPTALTDAYGMLKVICGQELKKESWVVVNAVRGVRQGPDTFLSLQRAVERYIPGMELRHLGDIRFDPAVAQAVHSFQPFMVGRPRSAAAAALDRIAWRLVSGEPWREEGKKGLAGFLERLRNFSLPGR